MQEYIYIYVCINIECMRTTKQHYNCNSNKQEQQYYAEQTQDTMQPRQGQRRQEKQNGSPQKSYCSKFVCFFKGTNESLVSPWVPFLCCPKSYFCWIPTIHFRVTNNLCHKLKQQLTIASQYTPNASGSNCHLIEKSNNFLSLVNPNNWAVLFNEM